MIIMINKKAEEIFSSIDKETLQKEARNISNLLNSSEGEKLKQSIDSIDKKKLMTLFSQMDKNKIKSALDNVDTSKLNTDDIIKKLKNL